MTSKDLQFAKFINFHGHDDTDQEEITTILNIDPSQFDEIAPTPSGYFCAGIHPWKVSRINNNLVKLHQLLNHKNCLLVGESGLDKLRGPDLKLQEELLRKHIEMSENLKKPLIIHCVRALSIILDIRKQSKAKMPWIIHDFNGNAQEIEQCLQNGLYLSLGPTYYAQEHSRIRKFQELIPIDRLFLETDDCTSFTIQEIYIEVARQRNLKLDALCHQIEKNIRSILS